MVARINTSKNVQKALRYNEQKVEQGKAECLMAYHFLKDADKLAFKDKLHHFKRLMELNEAVATNTLHVSLNFDSSDRLDNEKLRQIANRYMERIGFAQQPYLVYRHYDAGHPHLHIVSTNVQHNGNRISMHNLGRHQSESARKAIEVEFGLTKAQGKKLSHEHQQQPGSAQKVIYGKGETKQSIAKVLDSVLHTYAYTSLEELNALLSLYNVMADRGKGNSRLYQQGGLTYRLLDDKGNKIGTPIRASAFTTKPTLRFLEKKWQQNEAAKQRHRQRLKIKMDWALLGSKNRGMEAFTKGLEKEGIHVVVGSDKQGFINGVRYVDHQAQCVFSASDLGPEYSFQTILDRCRKQEPSQARATAEERKVNQEKKAVSKSSISPAQGQEQAPLPEVLLVPVPTNDYLPHQLQKPKRKKKKLFPHH